MKIILSLFVLVLLFPLVSSASFGPVKQGTEVDLKIPLLDENLSFLDSSTTTQLTIKTPDQSILVQNASMSYNENFFNYTLTQGQTVDLGEYPGELHFQNGNAKGFVSFTMLITPSGTDDNSIAQVILIGGVTFAAASLILIGFRRKEAYVTILGSFILVILGLYILLNGVGNYRNELTEWTSIISIFVGGYISIRGGLEVMNVI